MNKPAIIIARRYLFSRKGEYNFVNINSAVAVLGITFGLAAIIVVLAVFNGFQDLTLESLERNTPDLIISNVDEALQEQTRSFSTFLSKSSKVVIRNNREFSTAELKKYYITDKRKSPPIYGLGREVEFNLLYIPGNIQLDRAGGTLSSLSITEPAALEMSINLGMIPTFNTYPLKHLFAASDIQNLIILFDSLPDNTITSLSNYQLEVFSDKQNLTQLQRWLDNNGYHYQTWENNNKDILSVLYIEKLFASFVMFMIVCIGLFNLLAAVSMLITIKKNDFNTLIALGFSFSDKVRMISFYGFAVITIGVVLGLILGVLFVSLQQAYGIIPISVEGAILDKLPVRIDYWQVVIATFSVYLLGVIAIWLPASQIPKKLSRQ